MSSEQPDDLEKALVAFFTAPVDLPNAPSNLTKGQVWNEPDEDWLKPWRITNAEPGNVQGYPCGEPFKRNMTKTLEEMNAELEALRAENESLKSKKSDKTITFKVSAKGAVSVYGLGRFPVTLYREQWDRLLLVRDELQKYIEENEKYLKVKE